MNAFDFDPTAPGAMATLALVTMRVSGLVLIAPVYAAKGLPVVFRTTVVILLTALLLPIAANRAAPGVAVTPATVTTELLIGLAMGLGAAVIVAAAEIAGDLLAIQVGLSGANVVDPTMQQSVAVLGQFMSLFVIALLLSLDGHLILLEAIAESLNWIPVGGEIAIEEGLLALVSLGSRMFLLGLRFAAPVTAAVLIGNIALGILARAVPKLNVLMVVFPVQIGLGLLTLALALPLIASIAGSWPTGYGALVTELLDVFQVR